MPQLQDEFKDVNGHFPIHFEDDAVRVYSIPTGEIFVENKESRVSIRINSSRLRGLEFTTEGRLDPIRVGDMIGWRVEPR